MIMCVFPSLLLQSSFSPSPRFRRRSDGSLLHEAARDGEVAVTVPPSSLLSVDLSRGIIPVPLIPPSTPPSSAGSSGCNDVARGSACSICFEKLWKGDYGNGEKRCVRLDCGCPLVYHESCILEWIMRGNSCPQVRKEMKNKKRRRRFDTVIHLIHSVGQSLIWI